MQEILIVPIIMTKTTARTIVINTTTNQILEEAVAVGGVKEEETLEEVVAGLGLETNTKLLVPPTMTTTKRITERLALKPTRRKLLQKWTKIKVFPMRQQLQQRIMNTIIITITATITIMILTRSATTIWKGGVVGVEEAEVVDADVVDVEEEAGVEEDPMITTTAINIMRRIIMAMTIIIIIIMKMKMAAMNTMRQERRQLVGRAKTVNLRPTTSHTRLANRITFSKTRIWTMVLPPMTMVALTRRLLLLAKLT